MPLTLDKELKTRVIREDGTKEPWQNHETNSIVVAFPNALAHHMGNFMTTPQVTDVNGNDETIVAEPDNFNMAGFNSVDGPGVVFGSGTAGVSFDDSDLANRFDTDVSYNTGSAHINQSASGTDIDVTRTMNSSKAQAVQVTEAGIIMEVGTGGTTIQNFLAVRDTIPGVTLNPGDSVVGTYTFIFDV